jgi:TrmH family RNA methyltransferase
MLSNIQFILCETSHPGNIGATARAMKNMGITRLTLVNPENFPHKEAFERASGADDVLHAARIAPSLEAALESVAWAFGTSCRVREFPWPQVNVKSAASQIHQLPKDEQIAVVFGHERAGLSNEQLQMCDFHLYIPANQEYASLNLSQAAQIVAYELFQMSGEASALKSEYDIKATHEQIEGLIGHFQEVALKLGFFDPSNPKKLHPRVRRLIAKAQLEYEEINILRGFLKAAAQGYGKS